MSDKKTESIKEKLRELLLSDAPDYRSIFKLSNELSKLDDKFQRFYVDAKTLIHLGRDSIKDHTTALLELVKNSYDADSLNVDVEVYCSNGSDLIRVADNGFGMTRDELINSWLRIGFSSKRKSRHSESGRRKTGEKGIGRISTDRLGEKLELVTKTKKDGVIGLKVDWAEFDTEGKDVFDIDVEIFYPKTINIPDKNGKPSTTGTEIKITKLRQPWTPSNIENLYYELSSLTPPFNEVKDFVIELENDVSTTFSRKVNPDFLKAAEIELTAIYDDKDPKILYTINDKYTKKEITESVEWKQLISKVYSDKIPDDVSDHLRCGPVTVKLLFFLRVGSSVDAFNFSLSDLREYLDNNAGIKIYRDNIAVKPYGFPSSQFGYDWIGLADRKAQDPAGISRSENYKVTPNQLIGAVFISRDNNIALSDSAAREGLVESVAFYDFRNLVLASITMLESHRASIYPLIQKSKESKKARTALDEASSIRSQLISVKDDLTAIKEEIKDKGESIKAQSLIKPIIRSIDKVETVSEEVDATITDLLNWQRVLSGLATMGISSAVFGHETEASITQFKGSASTAKLLLNQTQPDLKGAIEELDKALKHSKKVAAWGAYALTRVQREKRSKKNVSIRKSIETVVNELKPAFEAASIFITMVGDTFYTKTYQMDIESIVINLLTNSYTACIQKPGKRIISITIGKENKKVLKGSVNGYQFTVSDTGPGIAKEIMHRIYEPLFSTKTIGANKSKSVGTGLGLTIIKSIVEDLQGEIKVDHDPKLKGARFKIWLPLVI